jgi:hypothetical protein
MIAGVTDHDAAPFVDYQSARVRENRVSKKPSKKKNPAA